MRIGAVLIVFGLWVPMLAWAQESAPPEDPGQTSSVDTVAQYFVANCAGCHSIGTGDLSGPDLIATSAWPDAELITRIKTMEDRVGPISDAQLKALTALLKHERAQERVSTAMKLAERAVAANLDPPDAQLGKNLFEGTKPLTNRGTACIACHRAGASGGTFGLDLSAVHQRLGQVALVSAIEQAKFKVMSGTYRKHAITAQEAVHIAAYLANPDMMPAESSERHVLIAGGLAAVIGFAGIVALYRRHGRPTRKTLTRS